MVGQLQYEKYQSVVGAGYWLVGVAVTGGTLLTVVVIVVCVYKRKNTRARRQFKRLQLQLDSLDSNVRNECKQGQSTTAYLFYLFIQFINQQRHRSTSKEHTGRMANTMALSTVQYGGPALSWGATSFSCHNGGGTLCIFEVQLSAWGGTMGSGGWSNDHHGLLRYEEEEDFAKTARSVAWELIHFSAL